MFLNEPQRTNYDINFTLFGFDIRVHPAFFVMPLILGTGWLTGDNAGVNLLILTVVFFGSILVHELGHAFAFRYYGQPARIVLYWMGGLAIPDSGGPWAANFRNHITPQQKIIISAAGPIFGFLLALALIGIVYLIGGHIELRSGNLLPALIPRFDGGNEALFTFFYMGIWANVFFNVLNLAPIYPLDGGQIAKELFELKDGANGYQNSVMLSVVVGVVIAVGGFASGNRFLGFFFGFMAWSNYMSLQQMGGGFGGGFGGGNPWR